MKLINAVAKEEKGEAAMQIKMIMIGGLSRLYKFIYY